MINDLKINKILQKAKEKYIDNEIIAIRIDNRNFKIDDILPVSEIWEDGNQTGEYLNGTCAIGKIISDPKDYNGYFGDKIYIITGDDYDIDHTANDIGEVIIINAKVLEIIKRKEIKNWLKN